MIDNNEVSEILEILENMSDETLAAELLREFNDKSRDLGQLILNKDQNLDHREWKRMCDQAKLELDEVIDKIKNS